MLLFHSRLSPRSSKFTLSEIYTNSYSYSYSLVCFAGFFFSHLEIDKKRNWPSTYKRRWNRRKIDEILRKVYILIGKWKTKRCTAPPSISVSSVKPNAMPKSLVKQNQKYASIQSRKRTIFVVENKWQCFERNGSKEDSNKNLLALEHCWMKQTVEPVEMCWAGIDCDIFATVKLITLSSATNQSNPIYFCDFYRWDESVDTEMKSKSSGKKSYGGCNGVGNTHKI